MKLSHHVPALLMIGLVAGCASEGEPPPAVDTSTRAAVGSAAAKGGELSAVATVRQWISSRNAGAAVNVLAAGCRSCRQFVTAPRQHWSVADAGVTRQGSHSATVWARIDVGSPGTTSRRLDLEFEVTTRLGGDSAITRIVAAS